MCVSARPNRQTAVLLGALLLACGAPARPPVAASPEPVAHSRLTFSEITGRSGDETGVIFTQAHEAIEACRQSTGGKLTVHLHSEKGRLLTEVRPGSSLDVIQQRCVLEALSATHIDEGSILATGAAVKPTGFTSLLTVEW